MTAPRILTESQVNTIVASLRLSPDGQVSITTGNLPEQQGYARKLYEAIKAARLWKDHVSYAEPGTWAGMMESRLLLLEGIVVVVNDIEHPPNAARMLEAALKNAKVADVRIGLCDCNSPPKPAEISLYIGEKRY
jgi:hypothetical protein